MKDIIEVLDAADPDETPPTKSLRNQASQLILSIVSKPNTILPTLTTLLTTVLKPLFSKTHHPDITSTGRKNQLPPQPSIPSRFGQDSIFDPPPPWKTQWTTPLLSYIIISHNSIPALERRKAIESNFHLLVPPLLNLIDDSQIEYKARGCECLTQLCSFLVETESDILRRTGLTEVFIDALKGCFHLLPSLTEEDDSLLILKAMFPAYLGVVNARFVLLDHIVDRNGRDRADQNRKPQQQDEEIITVTTSSSNKASNSSIHKTTTTTTTKPQQALTPSQIANETTTRTTFLLTLLRHSLLHSLNHLNTSPSTPSSTISIPTTTFLLLQIRPLFEQLGVYACPQLQSVVPMLVGMLCDPFVTAAPEMFGAAVAAVEGVVCVCWVRVRERWWVEILAGLVEGWLNCRDDLVGCKEGRGLDEVLKEMERVVRLLAVVVGEEEFGVVVQRLVDEEEDLKELFGVAGQGLK